MDERIVTSSDELPQIEILLAPSFSPNFNRSVGLKLNYIQAYNCIANMLEVFDFRAVQFREWYNYWSIYSSGEELLTRPQQQDCYGMGECELYIRYLYIFVH